MCSPNRLGPELQAALQRLGPVRWVVSPNLMHHSFVADRVQAFPEARFFAAPELPAKRPDLRFDEVLGRDAPRAWAGQLEQVATGGVPRLNEVAFFHPATRTAVLTDLAVHIGPEAPRGTRLSMRLNGCYDRPGPTRILRLRFRDRAALRDSMARVLAWDFERLLVAHGRVAGPGARAALRASYGRLFPELLAS